MFCELGLHPKGLAPRIANYTQWREHVLMRLRQQIAATADPILMELLAESRVLPGACYVRRGGWSGR